MKSIPLVFDHLYERSGSIVLCISHDGKTGQVYSTGHKQDIEALTRAYLTSIHLPLRGLRAFAWVVRLSAQALQ